MGAKYLSNEELCEQIQTGNHEALEALWRQTERFIAAQARRMIPRAGADTEDYYQAGYLGLVAAAESYDPTQGMKFIGWLALHLKNAFAEAGCRRSRKQAKDPLHRAASLNAPLQDDESDGDTLIDLIPDSSSGTGFEDVDERIYHEQLHKALESVLAKVDDSEILRLRYYDQIPFADIAEQLDASPQEIRSREQTAIRTFRRKVNTQEGAQLKKLLDENTDFFRHVGVAAFNRDHTSAVEFAVFEREQKTRQFSQ